MGALSGDHRIKSKSDTKEIYRDDEKIATFKAGVTGTGDAGDSWEISSGYQLYYDATAFPGKINTYKIVAILFEGCRVETTKELSIPQTVIANIYPTYMNGRKVRLQWSPITGSHFDVHYEIYRDDEKIATFKAGVTGTGNAGDSWEISSGYQFYYDATAFPGKTHTYKIVAILFEGCRIEITKEISIPQAVITNLFSTYMNGRKVRLQWSSITGFHFDIHYEIYRDDEKIASFKAGATGTGDAGDSWEIISGYQYYYDATAFPGKTHTYKIVTILFPGFEVLAEKVFAVPNTIFNSISISYSGVRTVQIYWPRITATDVNATYTVYRDGEKLASFGADTAGSATNGDSWKMTGSNQYYYDTNAWPNKTHEYKIIASLFPGYELSVEKDFLVPTTILSTPNFVYDHRRNVQLSWPRIPAHPSLNAIQYTVFRDGVELASFTENTSGSGTNNDSWTSNTLYQYYVDGTAVPYQTHAYKVEARLFDDCRVAQEKIYSVPGPKIINPSPTAESINIARINIGSPTVYFADATLEIYRDGQKIDTLTSVNNVFPYTYLDTGVDVAASDHYYQFLFRLYPGCDSGLSEQFPLIIPQPQMPTLTVVKNEQGAVTLRCAGANIKIPQRYEIYRDGLFLGTTEIGATIDFIDANSVFGKLFAYEARTRFEQFPSSYVSVRCNPVHVVTPLATGQVYNVVTSLASNVSPAWVEGDSESKHFPISLEVNGVDASSVRYYNDRSWNANAVTDPDKPKGIPLTAGEPVEVKFTGDDGNVTHVSSMNLTWTPTDLFQRTIDEPALHIRKGDSLLLTASGTGTLLEIDADGDGIYELSGVPGQEFPVIFDASGQFTVSAQIDGVNAGALRVAVASVTISHNLLYIRSRLDYNVITVTSGQPISLYPEMKNYIPPSDAVLLTPFVSANAIRCTLFSLSPDFIGTHLQTRLNHYRGPLLAECELRVVINNSDSGNYSPILREYADGSRLFGQCVRLMNPFPELALKLSLTSAGSVFADTGTSTKIVSAEEFDGNNQANVYVISTPPATSTAWYTMAYELLINAN